MPLYDVRQGGRLLVRDIWYEGNAWSMVHLRDRGEFAYHAGFVAPADRESNKLDWERELRGRVEAFQFDGFKGKVAFTLFSSTASLRITPPSPELKLYLLGYMMSNRKMTFDLGGEAFRGQAVAEHGKVFRPDGTGLETLEGRGQATPEFLREMLAPLRTVKPQPLAEPRPGVTNLRLHRVFAAGRNAVRIQAAGGTVGGRP